MTKDAVPEGMIRVRFSNNGTTQWRDVPSEHPLLRAHRQAKATISLLPDPSRDRPSPASTLPYEVLQCILDHAPTALARQAARLTHSRVSRHWYTATKYPTYYAVNDTAQAKKLAARLNRERRSSDMDDDDESSPVRRLWLSLAQPGKFHEADGVAFSELLDACPDLDTLEMTIGAEWDDGAVVHRGGPGCEDTFGWVDDAIRRQTQLRVLRITKHNWIIPCRDFLHIIQPLQNLQILDLSESELEDTTWGKYAHLVPADPPVLEIPLRTLIVKNLDDPHSYTAMERLMPFARHTLRRLRVGKLRCDPDSTRDALSPLLASLAPIATQIVDFDCRIFPWHTLFSSKSFLDLNDLLATMTALESLEMTLSSREDLTEIDQTREVDVAILATLSAMPSLQHLVLHVRGDPPARELEDFARQSTLRSLTLAMGRPDPQFSAVTEDPSWMTDLPIAIQKVLPPTTKYHSLFYMLD